ncbi:MAG TPA: FdtA/QdtA family cupin domain-containing protein [Chloroflexota bacterium]|nr:FdtA/QdtA family cupin domain-containing protein [Chloroflexota bacterium]
MARSPAPDQLKNGGEIRLQHFDDGIDGFLAIAEATKSIPFPIRRVYWITQLSNPHAVRGKHAHKTLQQVIFCLNGSFELELDDGEARTSVVLDRPDRGIYLGPGLWHVMRRFSPDCVILVLASALYDEADYIRDYRAFKAHLASLSGPRQGPP